MAFIDLAAHRGEGKACACPSNTIGATMRALSQYEAPDGAEPFALAHTIDGALDFMGQAGALVTFLEMAILDSAALTGAGEDSDLGALPGAITAKALSGIGTLIAMASVSMLAGGHAERTFADACS